MANTSQHAITEITKALNILTKLFGSRLHIDDWKRLSFAVEGLKKIVKKGVKK